VSAQEVPLDAGAVRVAVLAETNAYRASKNIPQLQKNAALEAAATAYAVYLAEHEKMGHTADGSNPPQTRLRPRIQGVLHLGERLEFFSPFANDESDSLPPINETKLPPLRASASTPNGLRPASGSPPLRQGALPSAFPQGRTPPASRPPFRQPIKMKGKQL